MDDDIHFDVFEWVCGVECILCILLLWICAKCKICAILKQEKKTLAICKI